MNANKVADTILSWNTDDELSDEEKIFSGAGRDEEEKPAANIDTASDSSNGKGGCRRIPLSHPFCTLVTGRWRFGD